MTEREWLKSKTPSRMYEALGWSNDDRKLRLFAAGDSWGY
jgi:hypothetical protein